MRDSSETRATVMIDSANALLEKGFNEAQALAVKDALDKNRAAQDRQFVDSHFEKGRSLLDENKFEQALIEFNLALERDSDNTMITDAIETTNRRQREEAQRLIQSSREELKKQAEKYGVSLDSMGEWRERILGRTSIREELMNNVEDFFINNFN